MLARLWEAKESRAVPRSLVRLLAGFALTLVVMFALTATLPRGLGHWQEFRSDLAVHAGTPAPNLVGLTQALAWKQWPGMQPNPAFDDGVRQLAAEGRPLLMLCRSGARSIAAARRATELGATAYNVLEGFEGDPDERGQRGHLGGWRHRGLPWRQN